MSSREVAKRQNDITIETEIEEKLIKVDKNI